MKKNLSAYWRCQISGWSMYILLYAFFYFTIRTEPSPYFFHSIFLDAITGLFITHLMRLFIIKVRLLQLNISKQITFIFLTTLVFALIYSIIITWADEMLKWEALQLRKYSFWNRVVRVSYGFFLILANWNLIYFVYHYFQKSLQQQMDKLHLENKLKVQQLESEKTKAALEQQKAEMETQKFCAQMNQMLKLQQVRLQIASDLHDDMGSTLTSISYYSELVKMHLKEDHALLKPILDKIGNNARNIVNAMSDIVWVINPKNDNTSDLISRMKFNAAEMLGERNIQYAFKTNDDIEKLKLGMEHRKNLYLIYKEAIHNAVKYAQCNKVEIDFTGTPHQISLNIQDDGRGFNMQHANDGNGLINMKKRAEEINAQFEICSALNKGTHIRLTCKIT